MFPQLFPQIPPCCFHGSRLRIKIVLPFPLNASYFFSLPDHNSQICQHSVGKAGGSPPWVVPGLRGHCAPLLSATLFFLLPTYADPFCVPGTRGVAGSWRRRKNTDRQSTMCLNAVGDTHICALALERNYKQPRTRDNITHTCRVWQKPGTQPVLSVDKAAEQWERS